MTPPRISFTDDDETKDTTKKRLLAWCLSLGIEVDDGGGSGLADRAARARLRRCHKPGDALFEAAFSRFLGDVFPNRFGDILEDKRTVAGLARVAILLPHVKKIGTKRPLAAQLVTDDLSKKIEKPLVSEFRVRALVQEADADEAVARWRRVLPLMRGGVNAPQLADLIFHWSENSRRELAFNYFTTLARAKHGPSKAA